MVIPGRHRRRYRQRPLWRLVDEIQHIAPIRDPQGGLPSSPAALREASDARRSHGASPRFARLTGELGEPSYGYHMLDFIH